MVQLIRSDSEKARYWHRVDDLGCSDSRLVQPDSTPRETDVAPEHIAEFFEYSKKAPCPRCRWEGG